MPSSQPLDPGALSVDGSLGFSPELVITQTPSFDEGSVNGAIDCDAPSFFFPTLSYAA